MLSSTLNNAHHLLLPADIKNNRSIVALLLFVAAVTSAAAANIAVHNPMQRTSLFASPRFFPCSFIPLCRQSGIDCRQQYRGFLRTAPVAYLAQFQSIATTTLNPFKLQASSDSNEMSIRTNSVRGSKTNDPSFMEQLAVRLVQGKNTDAESPRNSLKAMKACIAVAGGGSNAASSIASIPGASSILLESIVTYDRRSFAEFVTQNIAQMDDERWLVDMENAISTDPGDALSSRESSSTSSPPSSSNNQRIESFQFCSLQAAVLLSRSALRRSIQLTPSFQDRCLNCVGVGCTSALVGKIVSEVNDGEKNNGRSGRKSKAFISFSTVKDGTWVWELELDNGNNNCGSSSNSDSTANNGRRSRPQEEAVISKVILLAMMRYRELRLFSPLDANVDDDYNTLLGRILDREGDTISEKRFDFPPDGGDGTIQSAALGASQIISGTTDVVAVLPIVCDYPMTSSHDEVQNEPSPEIRMETICTENERIFPRDIIIVPGSFNPPHYGHIGLANAAVSALRKLRRENLDAMNGSAIFSMSSRKSSSGHSSLTSNSSSLSSSSSSSPILGNLWSAVDKHTDDKYDPSVFFEMSVTNADKPPLAPMEVERRVDIFTKLPREDMPKDWAVILTNAPLFSQKSEILAELIPNDGVENDTSRRTLSFALGTDTMVRIINPKYYDNSREKMLTALVKMKDKGVHFIVGGRLEPGTNKFVNGKDEVKSLPSEIQDMFTLLTEDEFRMDISSTELRKLSA